MRTPRIFLPGVRSGGSVTAGEREYRHLVSVLRRGEGDAVILLDGVGGIFAATITSIDPENRRVHMTVGSVLEELAVPVLPLIVAVAMPRRDGMELAIRLGSETGLAALWPLVTARTVVRARSGSAKLARWRRIAVESAEQCRRAAPIEIADPRSWDDFLDSAPGAPWAGGRPVGWVAVPGGPAPREAGFLGALDAESGAAGELVVAIGPEGGFLPAELEAAAGRGFELLGFPTPVLRTPTAVAYLAAVAAWGAAGPL